MDHDDLVAIAGRWLRRQRRHQKDETGRISYLLPAAPPGCSVVLIEAPGAREEPDAIGWNGWASVLVECKTSRADFLADIKKPHRRHPERGMGTTRWYMTPRGLLQPAEIPDRWGLLEVVNRRGSVRVAKSGATFAERDIRSEMRLLLCWTGLVERALAGHMLSDSRRARRLLRRMRKARPCIEVLDTYTRGNGQTRRTYIRGRDVVPFEDV